MSTAGLLSGGRQMICVIIDYRPAVVTTQQQAVGWDVAQCQWLRGRAPPVPMDESTGGRLLCGQGRKYGQQVGGKATSQVVCAIAQSHPMANGMAPEVELVGATHDEPAGAAPPGSQPARQPASQPASLAWWEAQTNNRGGLACTIRQMWPGRCLCRPADRLGRKVAFVNLT